MTKIVLDRLDHFVLTARDVEQTVAFYQSVLGMERKIFEGGRTSLHFGRQKINLHPYPSPIEPKAVTPEPGAVDVCLVAATPLEDVIAHLKACGVEIEVGPIKTIGAEGEMRSVYFRDPDGNLIEISNYPGGTTA